MSTMASLRSDHGHLPGLDGLRAVAVSIVLAAHLGFYQVVPGGFGVTLFFFISGMLITRLLLAEFQQAGRLDLPRFYMRRFLRLYPALVLAVVAHALLYPALGGVVTWAEIAAALLYYANYFNLSTHFGSAGATPVGNFHPLGVQWSLAIEEQYYLFFPLLIVPFLKKEGHLLRLMLVISVLCLVWRCVLQFHGLGDRNYSSTDTRLDSIIFGALLTVLLSRPDGKGARTLAVLRHPIAIGVALAALLSTFLIRDEVFRNTIRYSIQGLALMPIVAALTFFERRTVVHDLLASRPMVLLGAWSYSIYLFHGHAVLIAENMFGVGYMSSPWSLPPGFFLVALTLTLLFAMVSYYGLERRFVALRTRFGSHAPKV